jgi:hypothetical protein
MSTALTPRVRTLVVCDDIRASRIEVDVFHLRGARGQVFAGPFPFRRRLRLYLVLASPRPGRFPAYIKVVEDQTDRTVFYGTINPATAFDDADDFTLWRWQLTFACRQPGATVCRYGSFKR